jgi:hypothetical protein
VQFAQPAFNEMAIYEISLNVGVTLQFGFKFMHEGKQICERIANFG